jgi:hypothetical protein
VEYGLDTEVIAVFTAAVVVWSLVPPRLDQLILTSALLGAVVWRLRDQRRS